MTRSATRPALILLAFFAFISLGLPDTLLGVAWPSIRATFGRPISSVGWLLAFGTGGYLTSSFLGGTLLRRVGIGPLLAGSCGLVTISLALYAIVSVWPALFIAALLGGIGAGAIDAGINAFGAKAFSPRVMNWLHACWGVGATLGPAAMTVFIANELGWRAGYGTIAGVMLAMTAVFVVTMTMWRADPTTDAESATLIEHATIGEALQRRSVQGQTLFFFLYVGTEAGAGTWLYTLLHDSRGVSVPVAGALVSGYWASLTIGRFAFGQLAATLRPLAILRIGLVGAAIGIVLLFKPFPLIANCIGAAILGFSLAPIFPTMISETPRRVGERFAAHSVGFQVSAAAIGIMSLPGLIGVLARYHSIEVLPYVLLAMCVPLLILNELLAHAASEDATAGVESRASAPLNG